MTLATRTGLRPCGKRYATEDEALHSKRGLTGDYLANRCPYGCGGWHLTAKRDIEKAHEKRQKATPSDTGPDAKTRALVLARDGFQCVRCGKPCGPGIGEYSIQHRKARGVGGGNELPNLILLCGSATTGCHGHVEARADRDDLGHGYRLESWQDPAAEGVMYASEHGSGITMWLHADGSLSPDGPEVAT